MDWEKYQKDLTSALDSFQFDEGIITLLKNSIDKKQKIFVAGNGGSAAIALHYVCDFSKGANKDWPTNFKRYNVTCLSSNIGYMTAISNDAHYDEVFKQQLINLASLEDILILISSSGNSPNIVKAAEYAKGNGLIVVGVSGFQGGRLKELADYSAHIEYNSYEICEDIHAAFGHFLACCLRED